MKINAKYIIESDENTTQKNTRSVKKCNGTGHFSLIDNVYWMHRPSSITMIRPTQRSGGDIWRYHAPCPMARENRVLANDKRAVCASTFTIGLIDPIMPSIVGPFARVRFAEKWEWLTGSLNYTP